MPDKKLSIITICYNEPDVEKTCESIVNQTWQDFEWIVIDGGSNKETLDIFEKYKDRIDYFVSEPDNGIYNACNKGLKQVSGEKVIFMNAGDSFYNNTILENIFKNTTISDEIIYSDVFLHNKNTPNKLKIHNKPQLLNNVSFFITGNLCTQAMIIPTELFHKYGFFNEKYKIAADRERWICFAKNGATFKYINMPIAIFNINGLSENKKYKELHINEKIDVFNKYFTQEEIYQARTALKTKYSFVEQIFSIKNNPQKTHKIITILGIHMKIKRSI